ALLLTNSNQSLIINLIRNPIGVVASSYYRIQNGQKVKFLRRRWQVKGFGKFLYLFLISFSWSVGLIFAKIIKLRSKNNVLNIRDEYFLYNQKEVLYLIGNKIGVDFSSLIIDIENKNSLMIGHNIGGNKFRFNKKFVVDTSRKSRKLPFLYKLIVKVV